MTHPRRSLRRQSETNPLKLRNYIIRGCKAPWSGLNQLLEVRVTVEHQLTPKRPVLLEAPIRTIYSLKFRPTVTHAETQRLRLTGLASDPDFYKRGARKYKSRNVSNAHGLTNEILNSPALDLLETVDGG